MRFLIYASALQADILALAYELDQSDEHEVLIAASNLKTFLDEPIAKIKPIQSRMMDRLADDVEKAAAEFQPDVTIVDQHFPAFKTSPCIVKTWYGLGWKAPNSKTLIAYHSDVKTITDRGPDVENPAFIAQCYGEHDQQWRIKKMRIHRDNCKILGMPFADMLLDRPYKRFQLNDYYDIDVEEKKTVLLNLSWHYAKLNNKSRNFWTNLKRIMRGEYHFDDDEHFFNMLCERIIDRDANILLCTHDRWRYSSAYLDMFQRLKDRFGSHMHIKHKDENPDNLADLCVADVMVSNLSSFISYFYFTGKPSVHLCPVPKNSKVITYAKKNRGDKTLSFEKQNITEGYMRMPSDNGGLTAFSRNACLKQVLAGLDHPQCCKERSISFIDQNIYKPDGQTAKRYIRKVVEHVESHGLRRSG